MATNLNKLELEKNNFIKNLSKEQFDSVIINKYKKVFLDYFDGNIDDAELVSRIDKNLDLVKIYENGDTGKIDTNQFLYSAIVEVALNYFNVANGLETCLNKISLLASYFQLVASANERFVYLSDLVDDVFFINTNFDDGASKLMLESKLGKIVSVAESLDTLIGEIARHEDVIADVEKETKNGFCSDVLIDDNIQEMFCMCQDSANKIENDFKAMVGKCADDTTGVSLDIMHGKLTGGDVHG